MQHIATKDSWGNGLGDRRIQLRRPPNPMGKLDLPGSFVEALRFDGPNFQVRWQGYLAGQDATGSALCAKPLQAEDMLFLYMTCAHLCTGCAKLIQVAVDSLDEGLIAEVTI